MRPVIYLLLFSFLCLTLNKVRCEDYSDEDDDDDSNQKFANEQDELVHDLCGNSASDDKDIKLKECQKRLLAIPIEQRSDKHKLGESAIKLLYTSIYDTRQFITQQIKDNKLDANSQNVLVRCLDYYKEAIDDINEALNHWRSKTYESVDISIGDGIEQATKCEESFEEKKLKSPLAERFTETRKLSEIAIDLEIIID